MSQDAQGVDKPRMIWPVAALAVGLLAFVIAYGTVMQARLTSIDSPPDE